MAIGLNDEFGYIEEEESSLASEEENFAPKMKGAKKISLLPEDAVSEKAESNDFNEDVKEEVKPSRTFSSSIYVVKVTTNKEDKALEMIADKVKKKNVGVYAVARPHGLRGYVFLESPDREHAEEAVFNLPYVKGIIPKVISYDEVKSMLEPVTADIKIEKNDIVEMIAEPFKKEKAKVVRVDKAKGEAVVSLLGAVVPIPVTVKLDNLRVIRREEDEVKKDSTSN